MSGYREFHFWSPTLGCDAVRLSMFNGHGHEFFMILPVEDGKGYRQARSNAIDAIQEAIVWNLEPGEVRVQ